MEYGRFNRKVAQAFSGERSYYVFSSNLVGYFDWAGVKVVENRGDRIPVARVLHHSVESLGDNNKTK